MASVELDERTARELLQAAAAKGLSVEEFVRSLLVNAGSSSPAKAALSGDRKFSAQEFLVKVEELSFDGPTLPADFSRADIYRDHD